MKKMKYGNMACEVSVTENYTFYSEVTCEYEKDVIAYAVEHFFSSSTRFCKECAYESWKIRLAKAKEKKSHLFTYLVPAALMELPGSWVSLAGYINSAGVHISKVELLKEYPY